MSKPNWPAWRTEFPGLQQSTYLNTVSLGQLSRASRDAVGRFLNLWAAMGASAWYKYWLNEIEATRRAFACLIHASPDEIALLPNVSSALAAISTSLDYSNRNKVIHAELDFPTLTHHWLAKRRPSVESVLLSSSDKITVPLESFNDAIDDRTALVATNRVYFTSGYIQDVRAIAKMAHDRGALCLIDDYQGTGQVPINVRETGVDILISGGLKWLLGGPGIAFMYVRRELISSLDPEVTGWFASDRQFDFSPHEFRFREGARRFEAGTPSVAAVFAARAGLDIINELTPKEIRAQAAALTENLVTRLRAHGFTLRVPANPNEHAAIVIVQIEYPEEIVKKLAERKIIVDYRPGAIRISPYFYNTFEENEIFVNALVEIKQ